MKSVWIDYEEYGLPLSMKV